MYDTNFHKNDIYFHNLFDGKSSKNLITFARFLHLL